MAVTRIKNNQITDATVNAAAKLVDYSVTAAKIANNLVYSSDLTVTGNLTVQGNTTTIDTTYTVIEDPVITLASNQTGSPSVDIGFIGERGTSNNIAFVWDESSNEFVTAFTATAETNTTISISSYANFHTLNANIGGNIDIGGNVTIAGNITGDISFSGNIAAGNLLTSGQMSAGGNVTGGNVLTAGVVSATGNVTSTANINGANLNATTGITTSTLVASSTVSATGNVTGGNVLTSGQVSATANVTGGNVLTSGEVSATGNITSAANISGGNISTAGSFTAASLSATGNIDGGNINTVGQVSATGNITSAANVTGGNLLTAGQVSSTGNVTGGNIVTSGLVTATGNVNAGNLNAVTGVRAATGYFTGNVDVLGNLNASIGIVYANSGIFYGDATTGNNAAFAGVPGFTQLGSNVVMQFAGNVNSYSQINFQNINSGNRASTDYIATADNGDDSNYYVDLGVNSSTFDDPVNYPGFYPNDSYVHNHGGNLIINPETAGKQIVFMVGGTDTTDIIATMSNTQLSVTGAISAAGNITGNYFFGNGSQLTGVIAASANAETLTGTFLANNVVNSSLTSVGTLSNLSVAGNITTTANVAAGNVSLTGALNAATISSTGNVFVGGNLTVEGNVNYINVNDLRVEDPIIILGTGPNGAPLTTNDGLDRGIFMEYYTTGIGNAFMGWDNSTGNMIVAADAYFTANDVVGVNSYGTLQAGNIYAQSLSSIGNIATTANIAAGNISVTGSFGAASLSASGNITGGNLISNDLVTATGNITTTANVNGGNVISTALVQGATVSASGNVIGGNLTTAGQVVATGNVSGGNVNTVGQVVATGNVTGGNLTTAGEVSATANVTGGNVLTSGIVSATGAITSAANVTGGNVLTSGIVSATGNVIGGNVTTAGEISATGNITSAANIQGGNLITTGSFTAASISATGNIDGGNLRTVGQVTATGNITGGNVLTAGEVSATGNLTSAANITGGNVLSTGIVSATANVTGGNLTTAGQVSATANVTGGNLTTAGQVSATANVTGGNILTSGLISATGNITGGNVIATTGQFGNIVISGDDITDTNGRVNFNTAGGDVDFAVNGDTVANVFYIDAGTGTASFGSATQTTGAIVAFNATNSVLMPTGNTSARPSGVVGMVRFNTVTDTLEQYASGGWESIGTPAFTVVSDEQFNGDGSTVAFTLNANATTNGVVVSINGVVQIPTSAYSVGGVPSTTLTFTEAPQSGDLIDVRSFTTTTTVVAISNSSGNAVVGVGDTNNQVSITGNLVPVANATQSLGTSSLQWKDIYVAGNTIYLGGLQLQASGNTFVVYTADGVTQANIDAGAIDVSAISSGTSTIGISGVGGNAYVTVGGTANVLLVTTTGTVTTGTASATGNITSSANVNGGNINATTAVNAGTLTLSGNTISSTDNQIHIDPATTGSGGTVFIQGNLSVTGNVTYINSNNVTTNDLTINVANNAATASAANGGGLEVGPAGAQYASFTYNSSGNTWTISNGATVSGIMSASGNVTGGNVLTAGVVSATGNVNGGNLNVTGNIVDTGALSIITSSNGNITLAPNGTGVIVVNTDIRNGQANGVGNIGSATTYFNTVFAKATSAQYADLAEMYAADAAYEPGTVMRFGGAKEVTLAAVAGDARIAGVVSTNPSYIMNATLEAQHVVAIALTGRVPTRVVGPVAKGDMMIAAGNGYAQACATPAIGTVIGKALEDFAGTQGIIEVVVGRL